MAVSITALVLLCQGCVTRTIRILSKPPGARAYLDGKYMGDTPVKADFTDYGIRRIRLEKEGFQTVSRRVSISPPIYQRFPLDIFCELVLPFRLEDERVFSFKLSDPDLDKKGLLERASEERKFLYQPVEIEKTEKPE